MPVSIHQIVSASHQQVWSVEGSDPDFSPAGLLCPDVFLAVNPQGYDDAHTPPNIQAFRNEMFSDPDVVLYVVDSSVSDVQHALFKQAKLDADDHYDCDNGGLYALWIINEHEVLIAGMDNGGCDIAQTAAHDVAVEREHQIVGSQAHCTTAPKGAEQWFEQILARRQQRTLLHNIEAHPEQLVGKTHKI